MQNPRGFFLGFFAEPIDMLPGPMGKQLLHEMVCLLLSVDTYTVSVRIF